MSEFEERYCLNISLMDTTHREFVELVNQLGDTSKPEFMRLFGDLLKHTEAHFADEKSLMQKGAFPAFREHIDEHQRVLGELHRTNDKVQSG